MPPKKRKLESACEDSSARSDLYKILQVSWRASQREIVQGYYRMALQVHPDRGGNAKMFQEVAHAYEVLSDAGTRHQYDMSLLEHGHCNGLSPEAAANAGKRPVAHVLADFPKDMVQVLVATPPDGWQQLLEGCSRKQLAKLLDCLFASPQLTGKKTGKTPKSQQTESKVAHVRDADLSGTKYLYRTGPSWRAEFNFQDLNVRTPASQLIPVLAFYHSSVVELRSQLLQRLQAKPDASFETAMTESLKALAPTGFQCRFTFSSTRFLGGKVRHTPLIDDLAMALKMRRDLQQASSGQQVTALKKKWEQMLHESKGDLEARRLQKANELRGYILCHQEACCDVRTLRLRRHGKQPASEVKLPLAELHRLLEQPDGKMALKQLLSPRDATLALPAPLLPCGWKQMPKAEKAMMLAMTSLKDLARFAAADKACQEEVQTHLQKEAVLSPQDFSPTAALLEVVSVLNKPLLRKTRYLDLRQMPASVISSPILWATLSRVLPYLECVFIHQSHAPCEPASLVRRFSVRVSA
eukprot:Skav226779  [mRNA]  locus=scaffold8:293983:295560:- [translate_table: standard]